MSFTFVHTADWQIGKPFGTFPEAFRTLLREARIEAIDRIAAVALAAGARHVLVAGDVFDQATPPRPLIGQLLARLAAQRDVTWHLLPGNHDPAQPGGVWDQVARQNPAANIRLHVTPEPAEIEPGVLLIPAPLAARAMATDPTAFMDHVPSARGTLRIGMAHGSVRGFDKLGEASVPIDPARAAKARLDYLALGDWHGQVRIDPRTWYPGTPEPDGYKDNAPGQTLVVRIAEAGATPDVSSRPTRHYHWQRQALDAGDAGAVERFAANLDAAPVAKARVVLKLDLGGRLPLADLAGFTAWLEQLGNGLAHLDADSAVIEGVTGADDLAALGGGAIATVARALVASETANDDAERRTAARALRMLTRFVGQAS